MRSLGLLYWQLNWLHWTGYFDRSWHQNAMYSKIDRDVRWQSSQDFPRKMNGNGIHRL